MVAMDRHTSLQIQQVLGRGSIDPVQPLDTLLFTHQPITTSSINRIQSKLRHDIQSCESIISLLTSQLEIELDASRISAVQSAIAALITQLNLIMEKARESETVVREITRDIRSLDIAKRNLVASMTALKRLQMLVNGVEQLENLAGTKRYREAASSLQAVKSLLDFFQSYKGVERIAIAWRQVNDLQNQLRTAAIKEYELFFLHDSGKGVRASSLAEAALALDAVGQEARSALIDWYTSLQLKEYRRIFRATDEAGQLDNVSRRYAWFRRVLKTHEEEHAAAFVKEWSVDKCLVRKFSEITKEDMKSVLIREQGRLNVATLLEALNSTLEFEGAISRKYNTTFEEIAATISVVFDPYLTVFVEAQDKTLAEMFINYRRQGATLSEQTSSQGGFQDIFGDAKQSAEAGTVLPSSTELFYFYRQTLEQCARLSTGEPFKALCNVYKKWLRAYADEVLRAALVRNEPVRRSIEVRPSISEMQRWCLVLNTADYCASTCIHLQDKLCEKIIPDLRETISLEDEREIFLAVISSAIQTLARELEVCSEGVWNQMSRGGTGYMQELASVLEQVGVVVRQETENKRYVKSWCDKAVQVVISRFTFTLVKMKPLSRAIAEGLLSDLSQIRDLLIDLPRVEDSTTTSFARYANTQCTRLENLIQVVMSDDSALVQTYITLIHDRSFANFQKVLDLKGVRKVDQNGLMDAFLKEASGEDQSWLSSLDMDPTAQQSVIQVDQPRRNSVGGIRGMATPPVGGESGAGRAFSDLRRFGSMFGAALSRPKP